MPFKGEIQDWPRFEEEWKYYCSQVLPDDIQKMRLLKRLLEGSAKDMSAYYRDTSKDYYDLMQALAERYSRPDAVLNYLNQKLEGIACPRRETAKELRDFYNKLDAVCRQLRSSGCDTNHRLYLTLVMRKLPETLLSKVIDAQPLTTQVEWNTDKVMGIIRSHVLKVEDIQRVKDAQLEGQQHQQHNKIDYNNERRVHVTQKADLEEDEGFATTTSETSSTKVEPSLAVKVESGGTLDYNIFKGAPGGDPWTPPGRVPPKGRHNSDRPTRTKQARQQRKPCLFCASPTHVSARCVCYKTLEARKERLKEQSEVESCASSDSDYNDTEDDTSSGEEYEKPSSGSVHTVTTADHTVMNALCGERSLLMTTVVDVSNPEAPNQRYSCPVFFDQGSSVTLMTNDLARKLNLPIKEEKTATFHGFGDTGEGKQVPCWTVDLEIHLQTGGKLRLTAEAVDMLCTPMTALADPREVVTRVLRHHSMAPQATITTPQILIGTDYLGEFDIIRRKKKLPNGFFVYDSLVGPLLNGKGKMSWKKGEQDRPQLNMIYRITIDPRPQALQPQDPHKLNIVEQDQLLQATEKMWKTEAIGIESPEAPKAQEDERLLKHFLETLTQSADGRYEVAFPFKEEIVEALKAGMKPSFLLPDNRNAAAARLSSVWKSYLKDNPQVRESYSQAFAEQLARGIIEIVDREHDT
ncbi:Zinc knuckle family protein, partial [Aphelenchoides avenae]